MSDGSFRAAFLRELTDAIPAPARDANVLVGIDGVDGAGKTRLADELARTMAPTQAVVRVSIDGYHHVRDRRYRRGRASPEGFWLDSYDYRMFRCRGWPVATGSPTTPARPRTRDTSRASGCTSSGAVRPSGRRSSWIIGISSGPLW